MYSAVKVDVDSGVTQLLVASIAIDSFRLGNDCGLLLDQLYGWVGILNHLAISKISDSLAA